MDSYRAKREVIESFLSDLKRLLSSAEFDIDRDFRITRSRPTEKNGQTLIDLDFNKEDVIEELKKLSISDYYQSLPDDKNPTMPDFHVFYIFVSNREIYVKVRIQYVNNVLCVSFHFPMYSHGKMPYNNVYEG